MPADRSLADNDVPSNKFNLASLSELQRRETPLALRRLLELQQMSVTGKFDAQHLQAIHRYIFQDVYDLAGKFRTVNISKPNALFPPPQHLKAALSALLDELAGEDLMKGQSLAAWAHRAAYFLGEINAIHPFREGNGRTQREFIRQLATVNGHTLVWRQTLPQQMIDASQLSFLRKDYRGLERILREAVGI